MKLLVTGGHPTPALAVIDALLERGMAKEDILFVGKKYTLDTETTLSFEYKEIKKRGIEFIPLQAGKLTRLINLQSLRNVLRIPLGFYNAKKIIHTYAPSRVLTFGGYLAVPVAYWAHKKHIPIYTHEQTIRPGTANKIIAKWANRVFVSFQETARYFPKHKVLVTGNPIRQCIFQPSILDEQFDAHKQTIYITGGNLGSHSINMKIKPILSQLLDLYNVIHQTGDVREYNDYEVLKELAETFPPVKRKRYLIKKNVFDDEIGSVLNKADVVVGRSGANTFFELLALKKPAVFIPLPWSARDEQRQHAKLFKKLGLGEIVEQSKSPEELLNTIRSVLSNIDFYHENFKKLGIGYQGNAAEVIANILLQ